MNDKGTTRALWWLKKMLKWMPQGDLRSGVESAIRGHERKLGLAKEYGVAKLLGEYNANWVVNSSLHWDSARGLQVDVGLPNFKDHRAALLQYLGKLGYRQVREMSADKENGIITYSMGPTDVAENPPVKITLRVSSQACVREKVSERTETYTVPVYETRCE